MPIEEIVPFRLTRNLENILGPFKSFGIFRYYFIEIYKILIKNKKNILTNLDSYNYDPLLDITL